MPETIAQLEADGFTHIDCYCEPCRRSVWLAFSVVRRDHPRLQLDDMTIGELGKLMPCGQCGQPGTAYKATSQERQPGYQRSIDDKGGL